MTSEDFHVGRKQTANNDNFVRLWTNIEQVVSRQEIDALIDRAAEEVKLTLHRFRPRNPFIAWSGGKDSLALHFVCSLAGMKRSVFIQQGSLEFPAFLRWVEKNKPAGLSTMNTGHDLAWLARNEGMCFPVEQRWYKQWFMNRRGQDAFCKQAKVDLLTFGRRSEDGNFIGPGGVHEKDGTVRYCPIRDWGHKHVLAVMHYYRLAVPPIYEWPNGWVIGTGPWPQWDAHKCLTGKGTRVDCWRTLFAIDEQLVREAAPLFAHGREFLASIS